MREGCDELLTCHCHDSICRDCGCSRSRPASVIPQRHHRDCLMPKSIHGLCLVEPSCDHGIRSGVFCARCSL